MTLAELNRLLRSAFSPGRFVDLDGAEVTLTESDRTATLKKVRVEGLDTNAIVLRMDGTIVQKLLNGSLGENRRTDFVLVVEERGRSYAILAEIKSGANDAIGSAIAQKFLGTCAILDYCESILEHFHGISKAFDGIQRRYVLLYKAPSVSKLPTRSPTPSRNDRPERALRLAVTNYDSTNSASRIPLRRLLV